MKIHIYVFSYVNVLEALRLYKCLSDDTRLKAILLITHCTEACVCDLMAALELEQPKISRHLAELRKCGVLQDQRRGKWVYYRLHPALPEWVHTILRETCSNNGRYIDKALTRLQAAQQQSESCC